MNYQSYNKNRTKKDFSNNGGGDITSNLRYYNSLLQDFVGNGQILEAERCRQYINHFYWLQNTIKDGGGKKQKARVPEPKKEISFDIKIDEPVEDQ